MAQPVLSPGDATRTEDRQGCYGPSPRGSSVLDDAAWNGVSEVEQVRFVRGAARTSPWCAVEHREIEWAPRSSSRGVRTGNHDRSSDRRDAWVGPRFLTCEDYKASRGWLGRSYFSSRAKWRSPSS